MIVNLLVICLNHFVKKKDTPITFQHLELPKKYFWVEAINTYCYVLNHVTLRPELKTISCELWKWRKPYILYFKFFYSKCFILNIKDNLDKFDLKSNLAIFLGFPPQAKHIEFIIIEQFVLKNPYISHFRKLKMINC